MSRDDEHDWSFYKNRGVPPTISRRMPEPPRRQRLKRPAVRIKREDPDAIPASQIKSAIMDLLMRDPDITVSEIFNRLTFSVTVSRTTVSGIRSEFRSVWRHLNQNKMLK